MTKIDDKHTMESSMDILEYTNDINNKDYVATDVDDSVLKHMLEA